MTKKTPTQNKTLRTGKPWSHSPFGLDGSVQTLLHKTLLTAWTGASKLIISSTSYLQLAFDARGDASWKEMSHITVSDSEFK